MINTEYKLSLKYRLLFYIGGLFFASASYVIGFWAYATISNGFNFVSFDSVVADIIAKFNTHVLPLFVWETMCIGIASTIGYLFDREVYYRLIAEKRANVDGLTGIYNHQYFQERLGIELERAYRYNRPISLIMFDLDDFKKYNDTWGHLEGDKLLKWFAEICSKSIRNVDILARYGGEEFVIILPETSCRDAQVIAERIRINTDKKSRGAFGKERYATVSAGIATFPVHANTKNSLILSADAALYYAKLHGKNRTFVYEKECKNSYHANVSHIQSLLSDEGMDAFEAIGCAVDSKDSYMRGHSTAVMYSCVALGEKMGMSAEEIENLRAAALLHDIGKIVVPESVLEKQGPLESYEWQQIENHAELGSKILSRVQQMGPIVPAVHYHHERYDGKGYPSGLSGKNIPLLARIIAIADAFDAMTNSRSYKPAKSIVDALGELKKCSGSQFDPDLVDKFIDMIKKSSKEDRAA